MKTRKILIAVLLPCLLGGAINRVAAQGTAFTYQGELADSGGPLNGSYDLTFGVFAAASGGGALATQTLSAVPVNGGLFTVTLDFGTGIFTGPPRYLEITVHPHSGGVTTTLSPRQQLTATPYAITAGNLTGYLSASQLTGTLGSDLLAGIYTRPINLNNPGNVFAGHGGDLTDVNAATLGGLGAASFWQLLGNAGTTPGVNFLGTTDNRALELKVFGSRALRLEPGSTPNVIGGFLGNSAAGGVIGGTIGGGGSGGQENKVLANFATVAGGVHNVAGSQFATVGGGGANNATEFYSTIGGGDSNTAGGDRGTVGGGFRNEASGQRATIGGGEWNIAQGQDSTISGGMQNFAGAKLATVVGGGLNTSGGESSTLSGGVNNMIATGSDWSTIAGGATNIVQSDSRFGSIGGGRGNLIGGDGSTVAGGIGNFIGPFSYASTIGGGYQNSVDTSQTEVFYSTVSGGVSNSVAADYTVIGGGVNNMIAIGSDYSTVAGGVTNSIQANATASAIGGGSGNTILTGATNAAIAGGIGNLAAGVGSFVGGGGTDGGFYFGGNWAVAGGSAICGGVAHRIEGGAFDSFIGGGGGNWVQRDAYYSSIGGGGGNTVQSNAYYSTIGGGGLNTIFSAGQNQSNSFTTNIYSTIAGGYGNAISATAAFIGGGTNNTIQNGVQGPVRYAVIGGGHDNFIQGNNFENFLAPNMTIAGGEGNKILNGTDAFIGGGYHNTIDDHLPRAASENESTIVGRSEIIADNENAIVGGFENLIGPFAGYCIIGGGENNVITNCHYSVIPGGYRNVVAGGSSFAAGTLAQALHMGTFVWSDDSSTSHPFTSTTDNEFSVRCTGGARFITGLDIAGSPVLGVFLKPNDTSWNSLSDRNAKKNFAAVDGKAALEKLAAIPVQSWNYKWESDDTVPHIGPMAQDFKAAFYPGRDDKSISTMEFDGVELAAIQGLNQKLEQAIKEKDKQIAALEKNVAELKALVNQVVGQRAGGN